MSVTLELIMRAMRECGADILEEDILKDSARKIKKSLEEELYLKEMKRIEER